MKRFLKAFTYYFYNSWISQFPSYTLRAFYLRKLIGIKIGKGTSIHMGCFFAGKRIEIGDHCVVARNAYFDGRVGKVTVGNNVSIAPDFYVLSLSHDKDSPVFDTVVGDVVIGDNVWIGAKVMVLPKVTVGEGAVLGAGSVVTKDVEPFTVVAGNPAKPIGTRNRDIQYKLSYFPFFNSDIT
jgi:acetyltransferase-like isoleucine patch superfamily enzyme